MRERTKQIVEVVSFVAFAGILGLFGKNLEEAFLPRLGYWLYVLIVVLFLYILMAIEIFLGTHLSGHKPLRLQLLCYIVAFFFCLLWPVAFLLNYLWRRKINQANLTERAM